MPVTLVQWLDHRLYPGSGKNWDDLLFREEILRVLRPGDRVLDLGAGAGIIAHMNFRGLAAEVCGVDPDERVLTNPYLDQAKVGTGEAIPYPDGHFDLVFADNVLEHLDRPERVFAEVARVLRPGGVFLVKTPNKWHYVTLLARLTPHAFHQTVNRLRGRSRVDTFPTHYRANTAAHIRAHAGEAGMQVRRISRVEGRPEYLRLTAPTYVLGWLYERLVSRVPGLAGFRVLLIAVLEKKAAPGRGSGQG